MKGPMSDPKPEFPTPEQLEARLNDVAQLYDLGMALREIRFLDPDEARKAARTRDRVSDVGPDSTYDPRANDRHAS